MTPWQQQFEENISALNLDATITDNLLSDTRCEFAGLTCRNTEQLKRHITKFIANVPGLAAIPNKIFDLQLGTICDVIQMYPRLYEQIHLMEMLQPANYYRGLFSALAGFAIAEELNLPKAEKNMVLQAGLFHDIGLLYYPLEDWYGHLNETTHLNSAMRAHGPVGAGVIRRLSNAPEALCDVVKNHHERPDGTGYPRAISTTENQIANAIVAITDLFVRASDEYKYYPEHAHQLTRLVIQLNEANFPNAVYKATITLTRYKEDQKKPPLNRPAAQELLDQKRDIMACYGSLSVALRLLIQNQVSDQNRSLVKLLQHLKDSISRSGLEQEEYADWIDELFNFDSMEIMNINIMQNEICHLLGRLFTAMAENTNDLIGLQKSLKTQLRDLLMRTKLPSLVSP